MNKRNIVPEPPVAPKGADVQAPEQPVALVGAQFVIGAAGRAQLPPPGPPEIAFAGRSNAGKSSAINALATRTRLAFTSRTPGRTQQINLFQLKSGGLAADLPQDAVITAYKNYLKLRTDPDSSRIPQRDSVRAEYAAIADVEKQKQ